MFLIIGVLKIYSKFTGKHSCRIVISIKLLCNLLPLIYPVHPLNKDLINGWIYSTQHWWRNGAIDEPIAHSTDGEMARQHRSRIWYSSCWSSRALIVFHMIYWLLNLFLKQCINIKSILVNLQLQKSVKTWIFLFPV